MRGINDADSERAATTGAAIDMNVTTEHMRESATDREAKTRAAEATRRR